MSSPLLNTFLVCFGTATLASTLGLILAVLVVCLRVPLHRWISTLVLSLILIPIYVQATAWSAGFGVQGWFRLSQVSAATSPITGIGSVIWIHSMASTPICFLLSAMGLQRSYDVSTRQALLDFGPRYALLCVLIPRSWPWFAAGVVWCVATSGNDMVVTNLFQVPTITETLYQQVQFNELNTGIILQASSFAIFIGLLVLILAWAWPPNVGGESAEPSATVNNNGFTMAGPVRWIGTIVGFGILSMVTLIPIASLIIKAGWVATMNEDRIQRNWSLWVVMESMMQTKSFTNEIGWSMQLSLCSTVTAIILGTFTVRCASSKGAAWFAIALASFVLAVPGPLVNLLVINLFDRREPEWLGMLADRTLLAPILAQQSRCLPVVFAILWIANERYRNLYDKQLSLDLGLPFLTRCWIRLLAMKSPILLSAIIAFFVSFADLSSYMLVQPPQVTTVAMRMFDLLHYGIKNRESGLALSLAVLASIPTFIGLRRFRFG